MEFEVVTLEWRRLLENESGPAEPGLYQIYGDSALYGRDVLLYIGQAGSLVARLAQHFSLSPVTRVNNVCVRVAPCEPQLLDVAESILIATHKPSMNAEYIHTPKMPEAVERPYLIQNHGERGALSLQVTNSYWVTQ